MFAWKLPATIHGRMYSLYGMRSCGSEAKRDATTSAHAKAAAGNPTPITATARLEKPRPRKPLSAAPASGSSGMSQRWRLSFIRSELEQVHLVHVQRLAGAEDRNDDGEADGGFRGRYDHHEKDEDLAVELLPLVGERDEGKIHRVQHQLDRHERGDDVALEQEPGDAAGEEHRAEHEVPGDGDGVH